MSNRRALQIAVALAGIVPVAAGAAGAMNPDWLSLGQDSHAAYLSGLLLGIGLAYWAMIPTVERQGRIFSVLTAIVMLGGLARLSLAARLGDWRAETVLPLVMELGVTPALWLWQRRVARSFLLRSE